MSHNSRDPYFPEQDDTSRDQEMADGSDDDSLQRLSEMASRRLQSYYDTDDEVYEDFGGEDEDEEDEETGSGEGTGAGFGRDEEDEDEDDEDDDDEFGDDDPASLLRRLMDGASGLDSSGPPAELLRQMAFLLGRPGIRSGGFTGAGTGSGTGSGGSEQPFSFSDVIQHLVSNSGRGAGAGAGFGVPGLASSEFETFIANLNQRQDTYLILETLNELSERLLMMNGITAERLIPAGKLARALVDIMRSSELGDHLELQLVACRCLYNFLEVNQDFVHDVLNNNAVECLCEKLMEISYIDLTEQALQTLEMISRDTVSHHQIIVHNGLRAVLQYLDFLTIHAQRKCLTIVANASLNVLSSNLPMVKDVFDNIASVVSSHLDPVVIENGWLAISRIIMSFKSRPDALEDLFLSREPLLFQLVNVIYISSNKLNDDESTTSASSLAFVPESSSKVPLKFSSCLSLLRSLITLAGTSVNILRILIAKCSIGEVVVKSLNKYSKKASTSETPTTITSTTSNDNISIEALMAAPKDLLLEMLNLLGYLLPISYSPSDTPFLKNSHQEYDVRVNLNQERCRMYTDDISVEYWKFVNDIWSLLINGFQATMDYETRRKIIISMHRITSFCKDIDDINKIKGVDMISGILTSVANNSKTFIVKEFEKGESDMMSEDSDEEDTLRVRKPQDMGKLHANILLLSSLMMSQNLIKRYPSFVGEFEREGLFNDTVLISNSLKSTYDVAEIKESQKDETTHAPLISAYTNEFIDTEFTKEYEFRLTNDDIYKDLLLVGDSIEQLHITSKSSGNNPVSNHTKILTSIIEILSEPKAVKSQSKEQWVQIWNQIKGSLQGDSVVSSFEFVSSGIIEALYKLFSESEDFESSTYFTTFIDVFFHDNNMSLLVAKLQEALTRTESFEIVSSGGGSNLRFDAQSGSLIDGHTAAMARQIKIKLVSQDASPVPSSMQNMILSVHAIATFKSVENFLKQRFRVLEQLAGKEDSSDEEEEVTEDMDSTTTRPKLINTEFLINGEVIHPDTTIYGAIYKSLQEEADSSVEPSKIWSSIHSVTFRKVSSAVEESAMAIHFSPQINENEIESYDKTTINVLKLLKILFDMNTFVKAHGGDFILNDNFTNWKLTVKLNRQLEEPLVVASGTLPGWSIHITKQFPFIFPLDTRVFFLQSTSFGYSRLIHHWQIRTNQDYSESSSNSQRPQLGRPTRQKVRISRKLILQSAVKVLQIYGTTPGVLEIEYFDEVGSGLGPTLEFYATVSKEFYRKRLCLWRDTDEDPEYVTGNGLFPRPFDKHQLHSENGRKVVYFFAILGRFVARALLDSRIIDFNFNVMFLKLLQAVMKSSTKSKESKKIATISNLRLLDSRLADSLQYLTKFVDAYKGVPEEKRHLVQVDGCTLSDLSLTFTLPGYDYEMIPNGSEVSVTPSNLETYISKFLEETLCTGVVHQVKAFMDGFSKVFPISSLAIFAPNELSEMFGSAKEDWSASTISGAISANHGYTKDSDAIKTLVDILVSFSDIERRVFLQFLTGSPKLPIGGFKALRPQLTVVKKNPEDGLTSDDYLPSVMTCANYLKLPNYSTEEVMRKRLLQAIHEGAGAFLLS